MLKTVFLLLHSLPKIVPAPTPAVAFNEILEYILRASFGSRLLLLFLSPSDPPLPSCTSPHLLFRIFTLLTKHQTLSTTLSTEEVTLDKLRTSTSSSKVGRLFHLLRFPHR